LIHSTLGEIMDIRFRCEQCGRACTAPREHEGKRTRCRNCGHLQQIAEPAAPRLDARVYALAEMPIAESSPRPAPAEPPQRGRRRPNSWTDRIRAYAQEASHLQGLSLCLVLLSAADLFMTFTLLRTSQRFSESNPVALWVFQRWNIAGMTIFKFAVIAAAIVLAEIIERRRPGWGKLVLLVGCAAAAAVFWHGWQLYLGHTAMPAADRP
jgi:hypothetical protein